MLKQTRGFSLIELLVTLAVLAFVMAIGIPSFSEYLTNTRVRSVASEIRTGLQAARTEAVKRNDQAVFCLSTTNGTGWEVRSGNSCSGGTVLTSKAGASSEASTVNLSPTSASIVFGSDGRMRTSTGATASGTGLTNIDATWKKTCSGDCVRMRVEISPGGMVRTCNRNLPQGDAQACTS